MGDNLFYGNQSERSRSRRPTAWKAGPPLPPKVVSIPIHFVNSKQKMSEPASAVKIQKVWRGFLVRKSLKTILEIGREVGKFERTVSGTGFAASVQEDPKERLRVCESIMGLLLRLDSVRGFDVGVRGCRREVIRKAIRLQELVDSMAIGSGEGVGDNDTWVGQKGATETAKSVDASVLKDCCKESGECFGAGRRDSGCGERDDVVVRETIDGHPIEESKSHHDSDVVLFDGTGMKSSSRGVEPDGQQTPKGGDGDGDGDGDGEEKIIEVVASGGVDELNNRDQPKTVTDLSDGERSRKIMESLMEVNAKLAGLVAELNEKNALQTQLMGSLAKRVEKLERAFKSEKLRRKKKKSKWCVVVESPDSKELEE